MLCLMALLFGVGGSMLIALSFESSLEREKEAARETYQTIVDTVAMVGSLDILTTGEDVSEAIDQLYARSGSYWSALRFSSGNEVLFQSGFSNSGFADDLEEVDADHGAMIVRADGRGAWCLQLSGICTIGDEAYCLDAMHDITPLYEARERQQAVFRIVFAMLVVLCAVLAYGMSWFLTRPLAKLSLASREIASGNLAFRSSVQSDDEIGELSSDFDTMAQQVEQSVTDMQLSLERQERFGESFAHEVKTPLTAIIGYADLIRGQFLDPREQAEAAQYIFSEGKRLENLSFKLLDLFVLEKNDLPLTIASPADLVRNAVAHASSTRQSEGVSIEGRCEEGLCYLESDLVQSLLANLIDNAKKAVGERGAIIVSCSMLPDGCSLCVEDNGVGIPADSLSHVTEAFYRVDASRSRAGGGVGLGLALCEKIAELHGGSLRVDSELGKGTRIEVALRGGRP